LWIKKSRPPNSRHLVEQAVQLIDFTNVGFDQHDAPAQPADLGGGLFGWRPVAEEVDHHLRAQAGKVQGNEAPNAAPEPVTKVILSWKGAWENYNAPREL